MRDAYFIGLDLGQRGDYTALTAVRRCTKEVRFPKRELDECQLQHLKRYDLGTPYSAIASDVRSLQKRLPSDMKAYVIADTTGVGLPVFEMLEREGVEDLYGITIHGGSSVTREGSIHKVPKRDLVATLQVINQEGLMRAAEGLPFRNVLYAEMQSLRQRSTSRPGTTPTRPGATAITTI